MAYRPMSKPITPLRGLTPTLFSCPRPLPRPRPGSLPVCRATARRPNGFPGRPGSAQRVGDVQHSPAMAVYTDITVWHESLIFVPQSTGIRKTTVTIA